MWQTAYRFMIYDKAKLGGILFGIIISVFLIGAQLGSLDGMISKLISFIKNNTEYIYVVDSKSTSTSTLLNVDKRVGAELYSIAGVAKVYPIVVAMAIVKYKSGTTDNATIIGVQSPDFAGSPKAYLSGTNLYNLHDEGTVIVDKADLEKMGNAKVGDYFFINNIRVKISGISVDNAGLGQQNIITTIERARMLSNTNANVVAAYLIKPTLEHNRRDIISSINHQIPKVKAYDGEEFKIVTENYLKSSSGIVIGFMILVGFALFTGLIIVGLTMYSAVNDRIKDYGTIKAIGGNNAYIAQMIMIQAVIYAIIGFTMAMSCLFGLQYVMTAANQAMIYTPMMILFLAGTTIAISAIASYFSMRKILKLEPVQIFRM
jgi:putative ABC transport system permease protein